MPLSPKETPYQWMQAWTKISEMNNIPISMLRDIARMKGKPKLKYYHHELECFLDVVN